MLCLTSRINQGIRIEGKDYVLDGVTRKQNKIASIKILDSKSGALLAFVSLFVEDKESWLIHSNSTKMRVLNRGFKEIKWLIEGPSTVSVARIDEHRNPLSFKKMKDMQKWM